MQEAPLNYLGVPVTLVGHPFASIGRGEDLRCWYRALKAVGLSPTVVNIHDMGTNDRNLEEEIGPALREETAGGIDIYLINGDEIESVLSHLGPRRVRAACSVVHPVWELSEYPAGWARQLERFDEVWTPSVFVHDAIAPAVRKPVKVFPWSTGVSLSRFLSRRYFGISESAYAFLFGFDLRSYTERKNPFAVVRAFRETDRVRPAADLVLVIKMAGADERRIAVQAFREELRLQAQNMGLSRIAFIERELSDTETKNLVHCCDCFVSLHRSEGFGRFLAEAMLLGKPVVATGYSGNLDFMDADVSCLVGFKLIPVAPEAYPFWQGQVWAEPDIDEAVRWMVRFVDNPGWGRQLGERASRHIRTHFSYRAVGLQYIDGLRRLLDGGQNRVAKSPVGITTDER